MVCWAGAGLLLGSCSNAWRPEGALQDERLHAVMVHELDNQFVRLDALGFELHLTPAELDRLRAQRERAVARSAAQLQAGAAAVLALQPSLALAPGTESTFAALAQQLHDAAGQLQAQAAGGRLQDIEAMLRSISSTCDSCHSLYRGR